MHWFKPSTGPSSDHPSVRRHCIPILEFGCYKSKLSNVSGRNMRNYKHISMHISSTCSYSVLKWVDYWSAIIAIAALIGIVLFYFLASLLTLVLNVCAAKRNANEATPLKATVEDPVWPVRYADEAAASSCCTCCCCCKRYDSNPAYTNPGYAPAARPVQAV
jgi:hypothetical protein